MEAPLVYVFEIPFAQLGRDNKESSKMGEI